MVATPPAVAAGEGAGGAGATLPAEPPRVLLPAAGSAVVGPLGDPTSAGTGGAAGAAKAATPRPCATTGSETTVSSSDGSGGPEDREDCEDSDEGGLWHATAVAEPSPVTPPADGARNGAPAAVAASTPTDSPDEEEVLANGVASGATGGDGAGAADGAAGGAGGSTGTPATAAGVAGPVRGGRRWTDLTDSQDTEASAATKRRRLWRAGGDEWEAGGLYGIVKEEEAEEEDEVDDGRDPDGPRPWIDVPIGGGAPPGAGGGRRGRGGSVAGSSASRATPPRRPSSAGGTAAATPGSGGGSVDDGSTGAAAGSLKCTLCPATYGTAPSLNGHLRLAHPELLRFKCPYCPRRALTALGVHTHARVMHQTEPLPCRLCGLVPTEPTEAAHMAAAHAPTAPAGWLSCDACGDAFSTARGVRIHQSRVHRPLGPIPPGAADDGEEGGGGDDADAAAAEGGGTARRGSAPARGCPSRTCAGGWRQPRRGAAADGAHVRARAPWERRRGPRGFMDGVRGDGIVVFSAVSPWGAGEYSLAGSWVGI